VLGNNYAEIWKAQVEAISHFTEEEQEWMCHKTAKAFYQLG
jgi:L-fuconolactonase